MIDKEKRKVTLNDVRIDLSPKEFELISLLAANPGTSYTGNGCSRWYGGTTSKAMNIP